MKQISEATLNVAQSAVFIKKFEAEKALDEAKYAQEVCGGMEKTVAYWQAEVAHYGTALDEIRSIWHG